MKLLKEKERNVYAGTGISKNDDPYLAGKEAVEMAIEKSGKAPDFGFVFCSGGKYGKDDRTIKKLVEGAHKAFMHANPKCKWIGCTTSGETFFSGIHRESVVVMAVHSEHIRISIGVGKNVSDDPKSAGIKASRKAMDNLKLDPHVDSFIRYESTKRKTSKELANLKQFAIIVLSPGYTFKKSGWEEKIIEGIHEEVGINIPIVGGSASDDIKFIKNYQFANGEVFWDTLVCLALFSNVEFGLGLSHGYEPTKKIALVTKAEGNIAYELNNLPAVDVYSEMMGIDTGTLTRGINFIQFSKKLPDFMIRISQKFGKNPENMMKEIPFYLHIMETPLGVPDINGDYWLKVPKGITPEGGLEFYNPIYENHPLVLMKANKKKYLQSGFEAVKNSRKGLRGDVVFALVFECIGRYFYLNENSGLEKSFEIMKKMLKTENFVGLYTSCEIGSSKNQPSGNHTYTCSVISFSDRLIT